MANEAQPNTEPHASRRILVVDGNRDSATSLATLLNTLGHAADTAFDGAEALEKASIYRHNVIFLDIGLPGTNGYDVCKAIRDQPWSKGARIVALIGGGQTGDRQKSLVAGFSEHMIKPVSSVDLTRVLAGFENPIEAGKTRIAV
jgi:CheY-like chemotaxis protein